MYKGLPGYDGIIAVNEQHFFPPSGEENLMDDRERYIINIML